MKKLLLALPAWMGLMMLPTFSAAEPSDWNDCFEQDCETMDTEGLAPPVKVEICHFQEAQGTWKKMTLPEKAASRHLAKHDDAAPGGVTALTGTQLDEACVAAAPAD